MTSITLVERSSRSALPVSRRELLNWLFAAAFLVIVLRFFNIGNAAMFWRAVEQINVFVVGALCVAGWRLLRYEDDAPATSKDLAFTIVLLAFLALMSLLPHLIGVGAFLTIFAIHLMRLDDRSGELRAGAVVLLALATNFLFARLVFRLFLPVLIKVDAFLVGNALKLVDASIQWRGLTFEHMEGTERFGITLIGACSSFNNVSAAIMVHMAWAMALRKHLTYVDGLAVMLTIAIATMLNVARISLTALGTDSYAFWHGNAGVMPVGAVIFLVGQNAAMILAGYATARWAGRRNNV